MADYKNRNGVRVSDIGKVTGVTKTGHKGVVGADNGGVAQQWLVGAASGKVFGTTTSDASSGWAEVVDLGSNTYKDIAMGRDNGVDKRVIIQAGNNTNELMYHTLSASVDITDSSDWNAVNFDPNYKGVDYGPAIAYGSNTWVVGGKNVSDGDSHITLMRSTDGGASWSAVDEGNQIGDNTVSVCYKEDSTTWFMAHQSHIWKSTNNGATWTDEGALEGTKDIYAMAYDGSSRWVAVLNGGNIYTSDDDWASNDERTGACGSYNIVGIVYAGGSIKKWVAIGTSGRLQYSADGESWTAIWEGDDSNWGSTHIRAIATDDQTIVIVGDSGKIATSTNGTSFTVRSISGNPTTSLKTVACDRINLGRT